MTVKAGTIVTVAGHTVIQRLQSQGLGDVRIPINTIREIGNDSVVDKVPGEPEFTFSMESLAVDNSIEALLHGEIATGTGPTNGAGYGDAAGTEYPWTEAQPLTICSPWKDPQSYGSGNVIAGHIIPGYFPSKLDYKFGVTENASITAELRGGTFYYGLGAPTEDTLLASAGNKGPYTTLEPVIRYRVGGVEGTTFYGILGLLVNGVQMVQGEDYVENETPGPIGGTAVLGFTFTSYTPKAGDTIRVAYFTDNAHAYPTSVQESSLILPGAIRGRNIKLSVSTISIDPDTGVETFGAWQMVYGVQTVTLSASFDITPERELANDKIISYTVNGTDVTGTLTQHAKDASAFFNLIAQSTGLNTQQELVGWLNINPLRLKIELQNPRNPSEVLKTLYVPDAFITIPGTPAKANAVVDFSMSWESITGVFSAYQGECPL